MPTLGEVFEDWRRFELDDSLYVRSREGLSLDSPVDILPFDGKRPRVIEGGVYLLGIEQVRDVVDGLASELGRSPTMTERLVAMLHYADHDATIDAADL